MPTAAQVVCALTSGNNDSVMYPLVCSQEKHIINPLAPHLHERVMQADISTAAGHTKAVQLAIMGESTAPPSY